MFGEPSAQGVSRTANSGIEETHGTLPAASESKIFLQGELAQPQSPLEPVQEAGEKRLAKDYSFIAPFCCFRDFDWIYCRGVALRLPHEAQAPHFLTGVITGCKD